MKKTKEEKLEELIKKRESLIKEYIGVFNKPPSYFKELEEVEQELMKSEGLL
jgi:hypothetical protein